MTFWLCGVPIYSFHYRGRFLCVFLSNASLGGLGLEHQTGQSPGAAHQPHVGQTIQPHRGHLFSHRHWCKDLEGVTTSNLLSALGM